MLETISRHRSHGGVQGFYRHASTACAGPMRFALYQPPQAEHHACPVLYFLAGLTCTEETATIKAGAQRLAAELGLILVMPDTSPRDTGFEGATGDWEFGEGAGFYVDATQAPYADRFNMHRYVVVELPAETRRILIDRAQGRLFSEPDSGEEEEGKNDSQVAEITPVAREILKLIPPDRAMQLDELHESLERYSSSELIAGIFELEMSGLIRQLPGKNFVKVW